MRALIAVSLSFVPWVAEAAVPPVCGPDCGRPGHYILCNDGLDTTPMTGGIITFNSIEWACAVFTAPAATPFTLEGAWVLFAPVAGSNPTIFEGRVYNNTSAQASPPLPQVMPPQLGNLQIPATAMPSFVSMALNPTYALSADFRLCFLAGFDDSDMGMVFDGDGIQAGRNYLSAGGWSDAAQRNITGDLVMRASVVTPDLAPWQAGGVCEGFDGGVGRDAAMSGGDAGVGLDAATGGDTGAPGGDAGTVPTDDGGTSNTGDDAAADASVTGGDGGGISGDDGGDPNANRDAGSALPPPTITAISPNQGSSGAEVSVIVTGTGFVSGLSLEIGAIAANEIAVPGSTTIQARVPPGIAAGVYDVVVQNPDGQAAVLSKAYTVVVGGPSVEDGCGCATTGQGPRPALLLGALALIGWVGRRRR